MISNHHSSIMPEPAVAAFKKSAELEKKLEAQQVPVVSQAAEVQQVPVVSQAAEAQQAPVVSETAEVKVEDVKAVEA